MELTVAQIGSGVLPDEQRPHHAGASNARPMGRAQ
jgi:hypothetical protein